VPLAGTVPQAPPGSPADDAGSPKTAPPGRPRRPSPPRRRCATRAGSSGSPPARAGTGCVARPGLSPQPVAASTFCQILGLADRSGSQAGLSGRKWRQGPAVPRPAASASWLATAAFAMLREGLTGPSPPEEQHR
jgi:hypothetical protein